MQGPDVGEAPNRLLRHRSLTFNDPDSATQAEAIESNRSEAHVSDGTHTGINAPSTSKLAPSSEHYSNLLNLEGITSYITENDLMSGVLRGGAKKRGRDRKGSVIGRSVSLTLEQSILFKGVVVMYETGDFDYQTSQFRTINLNNEIFLTQYYTPH